MDDRRYMSHEQRAAEGDLRYVIVYDRKDAVREYDRMYLELGAARRAARAAKAAGEEAAYAAHVAEFARIGEKRAAVGRKIAEMDARGIKRLRASEVI